VLIHSTDLLPLEKMKRRRGRKEKQRETRRRNRPERDPDSTKQRGNRSRFKRSVDEGRRSNEER